jgi:hypothetical protein
VPSTRPRRARGFERMDVDHNGFIDAEMAAAHDWMLERRRLPP